MLHSLSAVVGSRAGDGPAHKQLFVHQRFYSHSLIIWESLLYVTPATGRCQVCCNKYIIPFFGCCVFQTLRSPAILHSYTVVHKTDHYLSADNFFQMLTDFHDFCIIRKNTKLSTNSCNSPILSKHRSYTT